MIRGYVPHRQTFPSIARAISGADGEGVAFSNATPDMIIPGVQ